MGCRPMCEMRPAREGAEVEKERRAWRVPACQGKSMLGVGASVEVAVVCVGGARLSVASAGCHCDTGV